MWGYKRGNRDKHLKLTILNWEAGGGGGVNGSVSLINKEKGFKQNQIWPFNGKCLGFLVSDSIDFQKCHAPKPKSERALKPKIENIESFSYGTFKE